MFDLALTSGVGGIILAVVFHKRLRHASRNDVRYGVILGLFITGNMLFEKLGIDRLPASSVSAIASLSIVIVPIILLFRRRIPSQNNMAGIAIIVLGIAMSGRLSLDGVGFEGLLYVLASCVMMSFYTVLASDYAKESDPVLLTVIQLWVTTFIGFVMWGATDPASLIGFRFDSNTVSYIMIIAFFSKAFAYATLMFAIRYADAISATVIAACEPAVTFLLALVIPAQGGQTELFSSQFLASTLIIVLGAVVANTEFLSKSRDEVREKIRSVREEKEAMKAAQSPPSSNGALEAQSGAADRSEAIKTMLLISLLGAFAFTVLCLSVNVYQEFDGLSKVRPANAIPTPIGILFGPIGATACAVGNLIADLFNPAYDRYLLWGFVANFAAGYLSYRVWRAVSPHEIDTHSYVRLGLFAVSAFIGNMACATILGCFSPISTTQESGFITFVFANDFLMSVAFGLPIFIALVSETDVNSLFVPWVSFTRVYDKLGITQKRRRILVMVVLTADVTVYAAILVGDFMGFSFISGPAEMLPQLSLATALFTCLLPVTAKP